MLWCVFDTEEVKQLLKNVPETLLEARAILLNEHYERFARKLRDYPYAVHLDPNYLDETIGQWSRLQVIEKWLAEKFPEDCYLAFGGGEAMGDLAHFANAVAFRDPQHALWFKLSW